MLTVAGLSKSFGGRELFDDVSITLQSGERVAIVGPNGAGKSTLFKIILGKEEADAGDVTLIRGTRIGYLPQESEPAGNESVLDIAVPHEHEHDGQFVAKAGFHLRQHVGARHRRSADDHCATSAHPADNFGQSADRADAKDNTSGPVAEIDRNQIRCLNLP